jgi:hypothetical protein
MDNWLKLAEAFRGGAPADLNFLRRLQLAAAGRGPHGKELGPWVRNLFGVKPTVVLDGHPCTPGWRLDAETTKEVLTSCGYASALSTRFRGVGQWMGQPALVFSITGPAPKGEVFRACAETWALAGFGADADWYLVPR